MSVLEHWQYAAAAFGFCAFLALLDTILAKKKNNGVTTYTDRRRIRGILGVGVVLAAVAWFVEWQAS
jgi:hypothetical protein